MFKKTITTLVIPISIGMLFLILLLGYLVNNAATLKEALFKDTVNGMSNKSKKIVKAMLESEWYWRKGMNPYIKSLQTNSLAPMYYFIFLFFLKINYFFGINMGRKRISDLFCLLWAGKQDLILLTSGTATRPLHHTCCEH